MSYSLKETIQFEPSNMSVSAPGTGIIDLTPFNLFIAPTEILTVSGFSTASATMAAALNWAEDI